MTNPTPLSALRLRLALPVGENAAFDGWTAAAVDSAAAGLGIDPAQARLAFPKDPAGMIEAWIQGVDAALEAKFTPDVIAAMKIRDRIRSMIWFRLETTGPAREASRKALAILAMPHNVPLALRTNWRSSDLMWRLAGDTATDFNHYSKRAILAGVYGATLLYWLGDASPGQAATWQFLDRRIENVMQFEKLKAAANANPLVKAFLAGPGSVLARIRAPGHRVQDHLPGSLK